MKLSELHKEIHGKLMQRKNPSVLWGSPFDNAWVGFILCDHKSKDIITLEEISENLDRSIQSPDFLRQERNISAASLYTIIMATLGNELKAARLRSMIRERILELAKKEKGKFSLFNSPEMFYSTAVGLVMSDVKRTDKEVRGVLCQRVKQEIQNNWSRKIYRFALYSGAAFELKIDLPAREKIVTFLSLCNAGELRIDEVVPMIWFLTKYSEDVMNVVSKKSTMRKLLEDKKRQLWEQFENQVTYFSYETAMFDEAAEISSGYSLSTFELGMIDDLLTCAEKVFRVDPNEVFDLIQLHPIVKDPSERLFKDGHYAQAIFEAYKSLNNYVRQKSGKTNLDGKDLMAKVFSFTYDPRTRRITRKPSLRLNNLRSQSDRNEQEGFMHLFMGSMLGIRNPKAHDPIVQEDPFRALEYLALASLLARRVTEAKKTRT